MFDCRLDPHSHTVEDSQTQLSLPCSQGVDRKEPARLGPDPRSPALCNNLTLLWSPWPGLVPAIPGPAFTGFSQHGRPPLPHCASPQATINHVLGQSSPPSAHQHSHFSCCNLSWHPRCPGATFPWRSFQIRARETGCHKNLRLRQTWDFRNHPSLPFL